MSEKLKIFYAIRDLSLFISKNTDIQEFLKNKCCANKKQIDFFKNLYNEIINFTEEDIMESIYAKEDEIWKSSGALITKLIQYVIKDFKDKLNELTNNKSQKKKIDILFSDGNLSDFTPNELVKTIIKIVDKNKQQDAIEYIYTNSCLICTTKSASKIKEIYQISALIHEKASNKLSKAKNFEDNFRLMDLTYENIFQQNEKVISELAEQYNVQIKDLQDKNEPTTNQEEVSGKQNEEYSARSADIQSQIKTGKDKKENDETEKNKDQSSPEEDSDKDEKSKEKKKRKKKSKTSKKIINRKKSNKAKNDSQKDAKDQNSDDDYSKKDTEDQDSAADDDSENDSGEQNSDDKGDSNE